MNKYPITKKAIVSKILFSIPFGFFLSLLYLASAHPADEEGNLILKGYMFLDVWYFFVYVLLFLVVGIITYIVIRKHRFYDSDEFFVVEKGLIWKKETKLLYKQINTISIKRSLLDLILRTAKVEIDTGSVISILPEARLHLNLDYANYLKSFLENKKIDEGVVLDGPKDFSKKVEDDKNIIFKMKKRSLLLMSIIRQGALITFVIAFTAVSSFFNVLYINLKNNPDHITENEFITILIGLAFSLFAVLILVLMNYIKYYNYKLIEDNNILEYEYGLFSRASFKFDKTKINAIYIKRSLLYRLFKKYSLEVSVIGIGDEIGKDKKSKRESNYLLPIGNKEELGYVLKILDAEELMEEDLLKPTRNVLLNLIILPLIIPTMLFISLLIVLLIFANIYYLVLINLIIIYLISVLYIFLRYKYHSYKLKEKLLVRSGAFTTNKALIKKSSIQQVSFNTGPIKRLLSIGNLNCYYRSFLRVVAIKGLEVEDFNSFNNKIFKLS